MCFFFLSASAWQDSPVVSWPAHAPTRICMYVYICISVYPFNLRNVITKLAFTDADSPLCLLTSSGLPPTASPNFVVRPFIIVIIISLLSRYL